MTPNLKPVPPATRTATSPAPKKSPLAALRKTTKRVPSRMVIYGPEGVGKTCFVAGAYPGVIVGQIGGEDSVDTLVENGVVPDDLTRTDPFKSWEDFIGWLKAVSTEKPGTFEDYNVLALDSGTTAEELCKAFVIKQKFAGNGGFKTNGGPDGFLDYGKGWELVADAWVDMLATLKTINERHGLSIVLICHAGVAKFKNPATGEFDRISPQLNAKVWAKVHRWADHVLYLTFQEVTITQGEGKAAKVRGSSMGGKKRVLHPNRSTVWDAKNRARLHKSIDLPDQETKMWPAFVDAVLKARASSPFAGTGESEPADESSEDLDRETGEGDGEGTESATAAG